MSVKKSNEAGIIAAPGFPGIKHVSNCTCEKVSA